MRNLAAIVTKEAIKEALEDAIVKKPKLNPATKFHLIYKNEAFPPKEVVRLAARKMGIRNLDDYRLNGGRSTNDHLTSKGFKIEQFTEWQIRKMLTPAAKNEQRISRLTFNTNGWQYPSGFAGKSKSKASYEKTHGFGHEEWLLDLSKLINGFHYGFLEPINKNLQKYVGNTYDVFLFTVNGKTNEKFWVGKLNNVEIIDGRTSEKIKQEYRKRGWYQEMKDDLENLGMDSRKLDEWNASSLFNVRFKPEDFVPYPPNTLVTDGDESITSYHYVLLHITEEPKVPNVVDGTFVLGNHNPSRRSDGKTVRKKVEQKLIEYPAIHNEISRALEKILRKDFDAVYPEHDTGFGTCIDLVAVKGKKISFYEIKTYNDVRTCIRQAVAQLIEYSYFPNRKIADELFIVTPFELKEANSITYFTHLRSSIGLPIKYLAFDIQKNIIKQVI